MPYNVFAGAPPMRLAALTSGIPMLGIPQPDITNMPPPAQQQAPAMMMPAMMPPVGAMPPAAAPSLGSIPPAPTGKSRSSGKKRGRKPRTERTASLSGPKADVPTPLGLGNSPLDLLAQAVQTSTAQQIKAAEPYQQYAAALSQFQADPQMDLSALANLVDSWTGSRFSQTYQAPETPKALEKAVQAQAQAGNMIAGAMESQRQGVEDLAKMSYGQEAQKFAEWEAKERLALMEEQNRIRAYAATLKGVPQEKDKKLLTASAVTGYTKGQSVLETAAGLGDIINQGEKLMGPVAGKWRWNPYNVQHQELQAKFKFIAQIVGKQLEGGVLRKEDETKYRKMLPNLDDLPEVAMSKAKNFLSVLKRDMANEMENYGRAGYDVSGFEDQTAQYKSEASQFLKGIDKPKTAGPEEFTQEDVLKELERRKLKL